MANSARGAGNFLGPLFIVATLVAAALVITFWISDEEVPNEATIIAEDDVEARPVGAGTVPEGQVDENVEGITDEIDEVDPAAPDEDAVPPAEQASDADSGGEGDASDTAGAGDASGPPADVAAEDGETSGGESQASGEEGAGVSQQEEEPPLDPVDEDSGDGQQGDGVADAQNEEAPAGRDAEVELNPEEGQDVVEDTDDGGTSFVPTPSGPEGRDEGTAAD